MSITNPYPVLPGERLVAVIDADYTWDRCPACYQPLVTYLGCGRHRGAWKDPASRSDYCSERCRARTKKRRHRARAPTTR